ncbi:MAG: DNA-directed RNA polymerase subunit omega [Treponema sp.]|nr:DNA-directed RNA polymerase subunit omega [Treponema sp.]
MIFPLEELIEYGKNMYEITAASSRRAYQLSILYAADDDQAKPWIDENDGKVVSLAARQVFTNEVDFKLITE